MLKAQRAAAKNQRELIALEEEIQSLDRRIQHYSLGIAKQQDARAKIYRNSALAFGGAAVLSAYVYFQKG